MNIGLKITELRKQKGWSQTDLARQIDVSRVIIGRYERNESAPSIDVAKRMADAFEVSLDFLVGEVQNAAFDKKILKWNDLKNKYKNIEQEEVSVPDWHKDLVLKRLEDYKQNPGSAMDFDSAIDDIEKEL